MSTIADRLATVQAAIDDACRQAGRPSASVRLVAASKGQPAAAIQQAAAAGQRIFGENYAREMREKRLELNTSAPDLEWHFIGRVQASNAKDILAARLVHGVGSREQAQALARKAAAAATAIAVLLQVSLWDEETKNGFLSSEVERELHGLREMPGLEVRGFMAMPPAEAVPRAAFARVRELRDRLAPDLPELSMGMSGDFPSAILEGATLVRVGTAIFGPRPGKETT